MDRGNIIAAVIAAVLGLSTVVLGVAGWVVMPANLQQLRHEKSSLEQQVSIAQEMANPTAKAGMGQRNSLPHASSLPGQTSQILTRIERVGGIDIHYTIGHPSQNDTHTSQEVKVGFTSDLVTMGEVFDWLNLQRPSTSIDQVAMSAENGGAIKVQIDLTLLGRS